MDNQQHPKTGVFTEERGVKPYLENGIVTHIYSEGDRGTIRETIISTCAKEVLSTVFNAAIDNLLDSPTYGGCGRHGPPGEFSSVVVCASGGDSSSPDDSVTASRVRFGIRTSERNLRVVVETAGDELSLSSVHHRRTVRDVVPTRKGEYPQLALKVFGCMYDVLEVLCTDGGDACTQGSTADRLHNKLSDVFL